MVYLSIPDLMGIGYNDFKNTLIDNNIPYSEIYFSSAIMKFIYIKTVDNYTCRIIAGNTDTNNSIVSVKIFNEEIKDVMQDDIECFEYYDAGKTDFIIY